MHSDAIQNKWGQVKGKIQSKWARLSDHDVEALKNNLDGVVNKIQKTYGYAKNQAEREYHDFMVSLRPILQPTVNAPDAKPSTKRF